MKGLKLPSKLPFLVDKFGLVLAMTEKEALELSDIAKVLQDSLGIDEDNK
jgi:hypothetical protein